MTKRELRKLLNTWKKGAITKTAIERNYLGVQNARGKYITRLWESKLGVDTRFGQIQEVASSSSR
jgi:hypothetical protein